MIMSRRETGIECFEPCYFSLAIVEFFMHAVNVFLWRDAVFMKASSTCIALHIVFYCDGRGEEVEAVVVAISSVMR
jgi:hypothetical protein